MVSPLSSTSINSTRSIYCGSTIGGARKEPSRSLPWDRERPTFLGYPARLLRCEAERELNFFAAFGPIFSLLGPTPFHCKSVK